MPDEQPDPMQELTRRLGESTAISSAMENIRRQITDLTVAETVALSGAFRSLIAAHEEQFVQRYARFVAPALEASTNRFAQSVAAFAEEIRTRHTSIDTGFRLDISRLNIDAVLASPFDALPAEQRESARRAVDDAAAHPDTAELANEVPDEVLDSLAESARTFASAQPAELSKAAQRKLFIGFIVTVFYVVLLQAQIEHDAVKELVEMAGNALISTALLAGSAAYAWDKAHPGADDDENA
ncbi:hypothetical protein OG711_38385 (plasmid) [Streptomyces uncialis]|uniref:hypothetical protein n=1 Tax=Streptomyces uncialis TaxID=1048205 RepID=UPI002E33FCA2|nr:hypothetical protein [Streptomyces uncialis]